MSKGASTENRQKMKEAEEKLLATGFSAEQWLLIKTYFSYGIMETHELLEKAKTPNVFKST